MTLAELLPLVIAALVGAVLRHKFPNLFPPAAPPAATPSPAVSAGPAPVDPQARLLALVERLAAGQAGLPAASQNSPESKGATLPFKVNLAATVEPEPPTAG